MVYIYLGKSSGEPNNIMYTTLKDKQLCKWLFQHKRTKPHRMNEHLTKYGSIGIGAWHAFLNILRRVGWQISSSRNVILDIVTFYWNNQPSLLVTNIIYSIRFNYLVFLIEKGTKLISKIMIPVVSWSDKTSVKNLLFIYPLHIECWKHSTFAPLGSLLSLAGMNSEVWFYFITSHQRLKQDFLKLNDFPQNHQ